MEVNSPAKRLHKHALPIVMVAVALLALPAIVLSRYNAASLPAEGTLARGLVTRVLQVTPTPNGLAKVGLYNSSPTSPSAGSILGGNIAQAGRSAQLSLDLQSAGNRQ